MEWKHFLQLLYDTSITGLLYWIFDNIQQDWFVCFLVEMYGSDFHHPNTHVTSWSQKPTSQLQEWTKTT